MDVVELKLPGLLLVKPQVFRDDRGFFLESHNQPRFTDKGIPAVFVQDNHSRSVRGTVRGLHFQRASLSGPGQAKLLRVVSGRIFDVAVDIRKGSPTFGQWEGVYLDAESHHQLFVPVGFAHGFCVVSDSADVLYKCTDVYNPKVEDGFLWNDPEVGVQWPLAELGGAPLLSKRDLESQSFAALAASL